jgi:hypothetical protein
MRRATLQAGLLGAGMAVVLDLITLLPYVGFCIALPLYPLAFFLTGLVAVRVVDVAPAVGRATIAGATAGLMAGGIGGLVAMFLFPVQVALAGGAEEIARLLPPETLQSLVQAGLDPVAVVDFVTKAGFGIFFWIAQLVTAIVLAATAAALYAAYRRT